MGLEKNLTAQKSLEDMLLGNRRSRGRDVFRREK